MTDEGVMGRTCAWCSAMAPMNAVNCPSCGAAMAQRDTIGDLRIPGVTDVRADLLDIDGRPIHVSGPSPSQGLAGSAAVLAMTGAPGGLAALGGLGIVGAAEYLGARRAYGEAPAFDDIGRPSDVVRTLAERLDGVAAPDPADNDPWRDEPGR